MKLNHAFVIKNLLHFTPFRPFFVQHSKINSLELIDVFTFGHVLFEMQSTYSLQEPFVREINECPPSLSNLVLFSHHAIGFHYDCAFF